MNDFKRLLELKREIESLEEELAGREVEYKGLLATVMFVNLNQTVTLYLENENGESWEEDVSWDELAK